MAKPQFYLSTACTFSCTFGAAPMPAKATRKNVIIKGLQVMTTKDKNFVKSFTVCQIPGAPPKPCKPQLLMWMNFVKTQRIKNYFPLTTDSYIMCSFGGKVSPIITGQRTARVEAEKIICFLCGKDHLEHTFECVYGTNAGSSEILGMNILDGKERKDHKFSLFKIQDKLNKIYKGEGIEAHHLINTESMDENDWEDICRLFGYDINKKENGVFLPNDLEYACHLHLPLHKANHDAAFADGNKKYSQSVKNKLNAIKSNYFSDEPCDDKKHKQLNADLDALSKEIFGYVDKFTWNITQDGIHYQPGSPIGCSNCNTIPEKMKKRAAIKADYNQNSSTKITIEGMKTIRQVRNIAYQMMDGCKRGRNHSKFSGKSTKNILVISQ